IHGDYRRQNILFKGDRLAAVIDFHRSRLEARSLDLAIALADILPRISNGHALSLARSFISSYERIQPLSADEQAALPVLVEARVAWRAFRRIRRIVTTTDKKKMVRRARKFQLYVSHLRRVREIRSSWKHIFAEANRLAGLGLLELIGGSYAQNMMRFFSPEHNLRQINEELLLYQSLLDWDPKRITTFWPTERLWETEAMAPVLTSGQLLNGGYKHVVIDDRLLHSTTGSPSPRQLYDYYHSWDPVNFQMHRIKNG